MQPTTTDINVLENKLLLAYMMKHVAAYYKVNKRGEQMLQVLAQVLDRDAAELETSTIKEIKGC